MTSKWIRRKIKLDPEDFYLLDKYYYNMYRKGNSSYAMRNLSYGKTKHIHKDVLGIEDKAITVDHINGDGLDNRKQNLRVVTMRQNQYNRRKNKGRKFKGVSWSKASNKWRADIKLPESQKYLGMFTCDFQAALVYDRAAIKYFKQYARPNMISRDMKDIEV